MKGLFKGVCADRAISGLEGSGGISYSKERPAQTDGKILTDGYIFASVQID